MRTEPDRAQLRADHPCTQPYLPALDQGTCIEWGRGTGSWCPGCKAYMGAIDLTYGDVA